MDSSFKTALVKDATINDLTSDLVYQVKSGASSTTYQSFNSTSPSNSSVIYNLQLPSESICVGRDVLVQTGMTFRISCGGVPTLSPCLQWGIDTALAPFPFAQTVTTSQATINNCSVSCNLKDVLPQILQLNDRAKLAMYNDLCPSLPDGDYAEYATGEGTNNNVLAGYGNASYNSELQPRGGFPVVLSVLHYITAGGTDTSLISTASTDTWVITVSFTTTEPVFMSPFTWGEPVANASGLIGINAISVNFNIGDLNRILSSSSQYITGLLAGSATNGNMFTAGGSSPNMLLKFLSLSATDHPSPKCVTPYQDIPRYITSNQPSLAAQGVVQITSQNLQLSQMPSQFVICVRKQMSSQDWTSTATFLPISKISVNINNASGLLSSASQEDLFRMSRRNGFSGSYKQFAGSAVMSYVPAGAGSGIDLVGTGGSVLVLDPAYDLSLPVDITSGSLGQFNFQIQVTVQNKYYDACIPELVIMCVNDGILVTEMGVSSTYTGILTRQMVLDAKKESAVSSVEINDKVVGGRMLNRGAVRDMKHFMRLKRAGAVSAGQVSGGRGKLDGLYR